MVFKKHQLSDYARASAREWLETNGLGGYTSSTLAGSNTRRYHGLLIAALKPPVRRYLLLARLEEALILDGERIEFSTNQYRLALHPQGFRYLEEFSTSPFPRWKYCIRGVKIEKTIFMPRGENSVVVIYRAAEPARGQMEIRPLFAFREHHALTRENDAINREFEGGSWRLAVAPYRDLPRLYLHWNACRFVPNRCWYRQFEYLEEAKRGLDCCEDLYSYGYALFDLEAQPLVYLLATLEEKGEMNAEDIARLEAGERSRRAAVAARYNGDELVKTLAAAADKFLVEREDGTPTIIAGYHWFTDWGRDAMISIPGLLLTARRSDLALEIIAGFLKYCKNGLVPNFFPEDGSCPAYNSVDASLWLVQAVLACFKQSPGHSFFKENYDKLEEIIDHYCRGTDFGIGVDPEDGLLRAGQAGVQLTWMDAVVNGRAVTERRGKAVEVNALWYNALCAMDEMAEALGLKTVRNYREEAERVRRSFNTLFWYRRGGYLYDCIDGDWRDEALRPNQLLAVSLPYPLLPQTRQRAVVDIVRERLLTPYGLRTLDPQDPAYRGRYEGGVEERDTAYHQGTVWPWLLAHFAAAYFRVYGTSHVRRRYIAGLLNPFRLHLKEAGVGTVSEIFDGDEPHPARGAIAQAWSVAEILRLAHLID